MEITFQHKSNSIAVPVDAPAEIKLYAVPTAYSPDGYFAAVWMPQGLEPVPACAVDAAKLLAHISIAVQDGQPVLQTLSSKRGVTYATD